MFLVSIYLFLLRLSAGLNLIINTHTHTFGGNSSAETSFSAGAPYRTRSGIEKNWPGGTGTVDITAAWVS